MEYIQYNLSHVHTLVLTRDDVLYRGKVGLEPKGSTLCFLPVPTSTSASVCVFMVPAQIVTKPYLCCDSSRPDSWK